jgi:hypothetical protein
MAPGSISGRSDQPRCCGISDARQRTSVALDALQHTSCVPQGFAGTIYLFSIAYAEMVKFRTADASMKFGHPV